MTTTLARPRPLPTAEVVHKPEPIRAKPQGPSRGSSGPLPKKFSKPNGPKPEPKILFQTYFKSVGPRTYAAQLKEAGNGNHFLAFTEGKRDQKTDELRKVSVLVFSEDFEAFFKLVHAAEAFVRDHPVPTEVREKQRKYWAQKNGQGRKRG